MCSTKNTNNNTFLKISDAILGELCALESHFPSRSESTSTASSTTSSTGTVLQRDPIETNDHNHNHNPNPNHNPNHTHEDLLQQPPPPPPPLMMSSQENIQKYLLTSEPQYISAESVRQNKMMSNSGRIREFFLF